MSYWLEHWLGGHRPQLDLSAALENPNMEYHETTRNNFSRGGQQLCALTFGDKPEIAHLDQQRPRDGA
jgi:hypothetical protein